MRIALTIHETLSTGTAPLHVAYHDLSSIPLSLRYCVRSTPNHNRHASVPNLHSTLCFLAASTIRFKASLQHARRRFLFLTTPHPHSGRRPHTPQSPWNLITIMFQTSCDRVRRTSAHPSPPPTSPVRPHFRFLLEAISSSQTFLLAALLWCAPRHACAPAHRAARILPSPAVHTSTCPRLSSSHLCTLHLVADRNRYTRRPYVSHWAAPPF